MSSQTLVAFVVVFFAATVRAAPTQYDFVAFDEPREDFDSAQDFNGFSKTFDNEDAQRFCSRHQRQYARYCEGSQRIDLAIRTRFCPKYEKLCTGFATKYSNVNVEEASVPLVIPPPLPSFGRLNPSMGSPMEFDLPIPSESRHLSRVPMRTASPRSLTPEMVSLCTADCRLPHCTTECKCIHSHPTVHSMCNPPPSGDLVDVCNQWYQKCPMFKPIHY